MDQNSSHSEDPSELVLHIETQCQPELATGSAEGFYFKPTTFNENVACHTVHTPRELPLTTLKVVTNRVI